MPGVLCQTGCGADVSANERRRFGLLERGGAGLLDLVAA